MVAIGNSDPNASRIAFDDNVEVMLIKSNKLLSMETFQGPRDEIPLVRSENVEPEEDRLMKDTFTKDTSERIKNYRQDVLLQVHFKKRQSK